MDKDIDKQ